MYYRLDIFSFYQIKCDINWYEVMHIICVWINGARKCKQAYAIMLHQTCGPRLGINIYHINFVWVVTDGDSNAIDDSSS